MNQLDLHARVTGPSGKTVQHMLPQTAPGRYEGTFTPRERGTHFVTLFAQGAAEEESAPLTTVSYVASYPGEYRKLQPNPALLDRLARETGGEMLAAEDLAAGLQRLYTPTRGKALRGSDGWWALAALGLLLFLADLVLRSIPLRLRAVRSDA